MPSYTLRFLDEAEDDLLHLDKPTRKRIVQKIEWLRNHFDEIVHIPLAYEFKDSYKLRVGKWRVLYNVNYEQQKIVIAQIDSRDKIYKR